MPKALVIGCGGIGSYLAYFLADLYAKGQIGNEWLIDLMDDDIVEQDQVLYQKFLQNTIGMNKAIALMQTYDVFEALQNRLTAQNSDILKKYELFILAVDNDATRQVVIKHCFETGKDFIDLRSNGSRVMLMPKLPKIEDNMKYIDENDNKTYSCQDSADLKKGWIQLGNRYIALRGAQAFLNYIRGHPNTKVYIDSI